MSRDSYQRFFDSYLDKDRFFEFGLQEIIFAEREKAEESWSRLKYDFENNKRVFIRSYGKGGVNSGLYKDFYSYIFDNDNIEIDATNNANPKKQIERLTGYAKVPKKGFDKIQNYQISHVFGRTKNALAFTAPWNIVYIPKIVRPVYWARSKGRTCD